jgi:hypothetical protein
MLEKWPTCREKYGNYGASVSADQRHQRRSWPEHHGNSGALRSLGARVPRGADGNADAMPAFLPYARAELLPLLLLLALAQVSRLLPASRAPATTALCVPLSLTIVRGLVAAAVARRRAAQCHSRYSSHVFEFQTATERLATTLATPLATSLRRVLAGTPCLAHANRGR